MRRADSRRARRGRVLPMVDGRAPTSCEDTARAQRYSERRGADSVHVMSDETERLVEPNDFLQTGMELMLDLAAPQARYRDVIEHGGYLQPMEGLSVTFGRAL